MNIDDDLTTDKLIDLYEATHPALAALIASVKPHADKRPTEVPSPAILDAARPLIVAAQKLVAREPGGRAPLELRPPLDWAGLAAKLALAGAALAHFHNRYRDFDKATLTGYWRTPETVAYVSQINGLEDD